MCRTTGARLRCRLNARSGRDGPRRISQANGFDDLVAQDNPGALDRIRKRDRDAQRNRESDHEARDSGYIQAVRRLQPYHVNEIERVCVLSEEREQAAVEKNRDLPHVPVNADQENADRDAPGKRHFAGQLQDAKPNTEQGIAHESKPDRRYREERWNKPLVGKDAIPESFIFQEKGQRANEENVEILRLMVVFDQHWKRENARDSLAEDIPEKKEDGGSGCKRRLSNISHQRDEKVIENFGRQRPEDAVAANEEKMAPEWTVNM